MTRARIENRQVSTGLNVLAIEAVQARELLGAEREEATVRRLACHEPFVRAVRVLEDERLSARIIGGGPPADVSIAWKKYRGPGDVKVADDPIRLLNKGDHKAVMEATTTATFSAPGEYWMRAQVNDESGDGGGGDQCCWTTAHVKVNVK